MLKIDPAAQPIEPAGGGWRYAAILELLTKVILLGGPVFYVLGRIYTEGYWVALGVSPSVMAVEAEDYIYYGFIVVASGLTMVLPHADHAAIWLAPLAAILVLLMLGGAVWLLGQIKAWLARKLHTCRGRLQVFFAKKRPALQSLGTAASILSVVSSLVLVLLSLSAALLLPIVVAHSVGKGRASKVRAELANRDTAYAEIEVHGKAAGHLLECAGEYCVVYSNGNFRPVLRNEVRWIEVRRTEP